MRHVHSPTALKTLRTLIKARLIVPENNPQLGQWFGHLGGSSGEIASSQKRRLSQRGVNLLVFRDATIVDADFITSEKSISAKPVIRMRLALKKEQMDALRGTPAGRPARRLHVDTTTTVIFVELSTLDLLFSNSATT